MADDDGPWERFRKELVSPWDWVAAGVGATGGFIVSAAVLHGDMGNSMAGGAMGALTAKKAGVAAYQRPMLVKRTRALIKAIEGFLQKAGEGTSQNNLLVSEIQRDLELLERKVISPEQYTKILDGYIAAYRDITLPSPRTRPRSRQENTTP